jgi:signal transduction histidine kinase
MAMSSSTPTLTTPSSGTSAAGPGRPGVPGDPPYVFRRATRDTQDRVIGGVASGLAIHLGVPVLWVRAVFVVLSAVGGAGLAMYAGLWLVLPTDEQFDESAPGLASASRRGARPRRVRRLVDAGPAIALGALGFGVVLLLQSLMGAGGWFWPLLVAGIGIALLWRQADEAQRERWVDSTGRLDPVRMVFGSGTWQAVARVGTGAVLVIAAVILFGLSEGNVGELSNVLLTVALGFLGLAIVIGPWVYRLAGDLAAERAERVRTQERADMAAHLHDSVLQTLALIQKNSQDSAMVARLARSQERDLRSWLFEGESKDSDTLAGAMRTVAAEVEDNHGVDVDLVCVGDCPFTEPLRALVSATREALVNAAKHAGTGKVDVYVEISPSTVEVFVRDRGVGFDPADVPADRMGVRGSIVDRMERHGGSSEIRSTPGEGTEVRLRLPLPDQAEPEESNG